MSIQTVVAQRGLLLYPITLLLPQQRSLTESISPMRKTRSRSTSIPRLDISSNHSFRSTNNRLAELPTPVRIVRTLVNLLLLLALTHRTIRTTPNKRRRRVQVRSRNSFLLLSPLNPLLVQI